MALSRILKAVCLVSVFFRSYVAGRSLLQDAVLGEAGTGEAAMDMEAAAQIESDVPCSNPVTYKIRNACDWSVEKFPTDFPTDDHWSPLCGTGHNDKYVMWRVGELSSVGVKDVAELGSHSALQLEVEACVEEGNCTSYVSYSCSPFSGTCVHEGSLDMNMDKPYVSLISMIAPSPDWFTGIRDLGLCGEGGNWIKEYKKDLGVYDSGTDSGVSYASPDEVTDPPVPIFTINATDSSNIFYNADEMKLYPVCTITITLEEE